MAVSSLLSIWPAEPGKVRSRCEIAFDGRAWERAIATCRGPRWDAHARLAQAWLAWTARPDDALALAEQLLDTDVAADAAYLSGYLHAGHSGPAEQDLARARFQRALRAYQLAGRHADASRTAGMLSRVPRPERRFDDELWLAQLAVIEADLGGDPEVSGRAVAALAEADDGIGREAAARDSFLRAEELMRPWPTELAHIYTKHAAFLLDLATPPDLAAALQYLDAADRTRLQALALGGAGRVASLALAIRLDRADALSQLGEHAAADRELAAADRELAVADRGRGAVERTQRAGPAADEQAAVRLVRGYVAARHHDAVTAQALFVQADHGAFNDDFRWRIALELARSYRSVGQRALAERSYRAAIAVIEQLRSTAGVVELRPWVLARRAQPYVELLELLVEQERGVDALVVAESLHARAWLDVVLGHGAGRGITAELALAAAQIRQRLAAASAPPLDAATLMATIGDREALVFFTLGDESWSAHVVERAVQFRRLPADALDAARHFMAAPGDPIISRRAAAALLPTDLVARHDPLYVVANGPLADVPFAALATRGRYLIDERPVARLPGLVALRCVVSTWAPRAVVLGDSREDLPAAAREARQLAALQGVVANIGPAASRQALEPARGARSLHIAGHGVATAAGRAIALSDGELTAADVLGAGLDPQVVMLNGCSTAASDDAESWGGFPSAFLAAGSQYVVATLRSVEDGEAAQITAAYYAQPAALNPIERLAAAQRQISAVLPVAAWAKFAAWGSVCDDVEPTAGTIADPVDTGERDRRRLP